MIHKASHTIWWAKADVIWNGFSRKTMTERKYFPRVTMETTKCMSWVCADQQWGLVTLHLIISESIHASDPTVNCMSQDCFRHWLCTCSTSSNCIKPMLAYDQINPEGQNSVSHNTKRSLENWYENSRQQIVGHCPAANDPNVFISSPGVAGDYMFAVYAFMISSRKQSINRIHR